MAKYDFITKEVGEVEVAQWSMTKEDLIFLIETLPDKDGVTKELKRVLGKVLEIECQHAVSIEVT